MRRARHNQKEITAEREDASTATHVRTRLSRGALTENETRATAADRQPDRWARQAPSESGKTVLHRHSDSLSARARSLFFSSFLRRAVTLEVGLKLKRPRCDRPLWGRESCLRADRTDDRYSPYGLVRNKTFHLEES